MTTARAMLRSDVYRVFVVMGVLFSLTVSLITAFNLDDAASAGGDAGSNTFEVSLTELKIEPKTIQAAAGSPITLDVRNDGGTAHNLVIEDGDRTSMLAAGDHETLTLSAMAPGTYTLFCEVAGHREGGMEAALVVGEDGAPAKDEHEMDKEAMDAAYLKSLQAFPAKTKGLGDQIMTPKIADGVKEFELTASEFDWEVAPGDVRKAMGYNGVVPGPQIRVKQGDRIRVTLRNRLEETTSIHFHGQNLPNSQDGVIGITQDFLKPGDDWTYEFTVTNSGTQIYHSHMNGANQIPLGLWGSFIVEGENEPDVDQDVNIVLNDGPLGYTINGKGFPATSPIVAKPGDVVRMRYLNEGLQGHPMHLHGMEQEVIAKDGWFLPEPYKADTIWVAPGERYDVLIRPRAGTWAFHCHILSHAEGPEGMFGMVTAVVASEG